MKRRKNKMINLIVLANNMAERINEIEYLANRDSLIIGLLVVGFFVQIPITLSLGFQRCSLLDKISMSRYWVFVSGIIYSALIFISIKNNINIIKPMMVSLIPFWIFSLYGIIPELLIELSLIYDRVRNKILIRFFGGTDDD